MRFESNFYICEQQKLANVANIPHLLVFNQIDQVANASTGGGQIRSNHAFASFSMPANVVGCTEQRHVPHGGRYKIFFPPFSIILKLCIRGEDAFTPYTRSVTLILVSFLS